MPERNRKERLYTVNRFGQLTVRNLLDWLVTLALAVLVGNMIVQLGGVRPGTQALGAVLLAGVVFLHGCWLALGREERLRLHRPLLLLVPLLLYLLAHVWFLSPTPWRARWDLLLAFEAVVVAWVAAHNLRGREKVWLFFLIVLGFAGMSVFFGLRQFSEQPTWLGFGPTLPMDFGLPPHLHGYATGTFPHPSIFAGLILLGLPPLLVAALMRKLLAALRIICFLSALLFFGVLVLSRDETALILASVALPALALICLRGRWKRLLVAGGMLAVVGLGWAGTAYLEDLRPIESPVRLDAGSILAERPSPGLFGSGGGSFEEFLVTAEGERYPGRFLGAYGSLTTLRLEYGWLGLALFAVPLIWIFVLSLLAWRRLPKREQDVQDMPIRRGKRPVRPAATEHLFQTAVVTSLLLFGVHLFTAFHLEVPGTVLLAAAFMGIALKPRSVRTLPLPLPVPRWLITFAPGVVTSAVLVAVVFPKLSATEQSLRAIEGLQLLRVAGEGAANSPPADAARMLEDALQTDPDNLDAQAWLVYALILTFLDGAADADSIGPRVIELAREPVDANGQSAPYRVLLGLGQWLSGDTPAAEASFRAAMEAMPLSPLPPYYLGELLKLMPERIDEAQALLARVEALDPNFPDIANRRSLLSLSRGMEGEGISDTLRRATTRLLPPLVYLPKPERGVYGQIHRFVAPEEFRADALEADGP
ncbi:MAG: hypothetical protein ACFB20_07330 [Opitutales bacterium]